MLPVGAGFLAVELGLIMLDLVSIRAGARLDRQLHALLRGGVQRLPAGRRAGYLREWAGELHEILHGAAARPVTRVWHAFRFVVGIHRTATAIARMARGGSPRTAFPRAFTAGCRALGLSWFGWPVPDPAGTRTRCPSAARRRPMARTTASTWMGRRSRGDRTRAPAGTGAVRGAHSPPPGCQPGR